jgi:hypothetical protein
VALFRSPSHAPGRLAVFVDFIEIIRIHSFCHFAKPPKGLAKGSGGTRLLRQIAVPAGGFALPKCTRRVVSPVIEHTANRHRVGPAGSNVFGVRLAATERKE